MAMIDSVVSMKRTDSNDAVATDARKLWEESKNSWFMDDNELTLKDV